jgi:hypothetical protein
MDIRKETARMLRELRKNKDAFVPVRQTVTEAVKCSNNQDSLEVFIHDGNFLELYTLKGLLDEAPDGSKIEVSSGSLYDYDGVFFTVVQEVKQPDRSYYHNVLSAYTSQVMQTKEKDLTVKLKEIGVVVNDYQLDKLKQILKGAS